jgi:hypothetical protein
MADDDVRSKEDLLLMLIETMEHGGTTELPEYFAERLGVDSDEALRLLEKLEEEAKEVQRYPQDGGEPDQFGPPGLDSLSERQVSNRLVEVVMDMAEPRPVSWFVDETGGDESTVQGVIEEHLAVGNLETYGESNGEMRFGPPGIDPSRTTLELREGQYGDLELGFPDGHTERAHTHSVGDCTVAASTEGETIAVFVDGGLSFTVDEYVKTLSPLSRSFAISQQDYLAYISGEHQENVLNVLTWEGDPVVQRVVDVSRTPSFTPNGQYVAHWRLTDSTVYCYDLQTKSKSGQFDTDQVPGTNIGVKGVDYEGQPAFEISDTTGQGEDEVVAYISPQGELLD